MDSLKAISYLGYSSIHPEVDDFLLENGIKKRPKKNEASETITDEKIGASFDFQGSPSFDEESLMPKKSDGRFILRGVTFLSGFTGRLPYGISLKMSQDEISKILGNPKRERPQIPIATYFRDGMVITVNWLKSDPKEAFIRFTVPNIYDKKNLNL